MDTFFFSQFFFLGKPFTPKKYFSIDRVFRNETMDATHLAEFHQVEGLVADVGLGIGDLKGNRREERKKRKRENIVSILLCVLCCVLLLLLLLLSIYTALLKISIILY